MAKYLFIIGEITFTKPVLQPNMIIQALKKNGVWAFSEGAANLRRLEKGDEAIIYITGKGYRYFAGHIELQSNPLRIDNLHNISNDSFLFDYYPMLLEAKITIWDKPVYIKDVIQYLSFIVDKTNYGLYLRQSTKLIPEEDFHRILQASRNSSKN